MNNSAVLRLKWTKALLSKKTQATLAVLEQLMSANSSFKEYRDLLHQINPPCVPYLYESGFPII